MARIVEFNEKIAIQKAMEVFWKKGYKGASMRDLTDAMQINPSSLYNTIGDKRQLFVQCIQNYTDGRMEDAKVQATKIKSPLKAIISFINGSVNAILYSDNSCLAIKTTFELAATDKDVQAVLKKDSDFTHQFLLDLVSRAVHLKEIDQDTDVEMMTDYIVNSFSGWHESYILHQNPARIKKMARYLILQISK